MHVYVCLFFNSMFVSPCFLTDFVALGCSCWVSQSVCLLFDVFTTSPTQVKCHNVLCFTAGPVTLMGFDSPNPSILPWFDWGCCLGLAIKNP